MPSEIETRLKDLGIDLPPAPEPVANYVTNVLTDNLVFISGQLPVTANGLKYTGKIGREVTTDEGQDAARLCAINILSVLKGALGSLERVERIVKLTGFVNVAPEFTQPQLIINGASDLIVAVLGDRGGHSRSALGAATLPNDAAVEIEAIAEIRQG